MLNLSKKLKQLRSQLLLPTRELWSLQLTTAIFPMPPAMVTTSQHLMLLHLLLSKLPSQLSKLPNLLSKLPSQLSKLLQCQL